MDKVNSIMGGGNKGNSSFYFQQELFQYWNASLPGLAVEEKHSKAAEYSPSLYLDLFDPLFGLNKEEIGLLQVNPEYLVVKGEAGTGKSAMLTVLAAYWIKHKKYLPEEILLLTLVPQERGA